MDPRLLSPATWTEPLERMRAALPEAAVSSRFSGTLSQSSFGGGERYLDESGDEFYLRRDGVQYSAMDALDAVSDLAPQAPLGVSIEVGRTTPPKVVLYELPGEEVVNTGFSSPISAVVLRAGALPEPFRRLPEIHPRPWDQSMNPEWLAQIVREALPDATGMSEEQLQTWEQRHRCVLPPDVRALYLAAAQGDLIRPPKAGAETDSEADYVMRIFPLGREDPYWRADARCGGWQSGANEVVGADPSGRVQALGFSPAWVPLGDDWGGNYFVADLAPGPNGTIGQILFVDHETNSGASWVAPSLTAFVANPPQSYGGDLPPAAGLKVRIGNHTSETLASVTPETEVLIVNRVDEPVDLSGLAGHRRLRTLSITPGPVSGVRTIPDLPALEYLETNLATWRFLLDRDLVPDRLLAAGFDDLRADWPGLVAVANELLRRWGRPTITEHVIQPG